MIQPITPGGILQLLSWAKGATTSFTVPANQRFDLKWIVLSYTCSAAVATRLSSIGIVCVNAVVVPIIYQSLTAGATGVISLGIGQSCTVGNYGLLAAPITLYPAQSLTFAVTGADAGDTWLAEGVGLLLPWQVP